MSHGIRLVNDYAGTQRFGRFAGILGEKGEEAGGAWRGHSCAVPLQGKEKRELASLPLGNGIAAIRYLWPEWVMRARMSRRLSATVAPAYSARSAGLHLPMVVLMAVAHLSMLSALG